MPQLGPPQQAAECALRMHAADDVLGRAKGAEAPPTCGGNGWLSASMHRSTSWSWEQQAGRCWGVSGASLQFTCDDQDPHLQQKKQPADMCTVLWGMSASPATIRHTCMHTGQAAVYRWQRIAGSMHPICWEEGKGLRHGP